MESVDFSIDNDIWKSIKINEDNLNKTSKNELYNIFIKKEV